MNIFLRELKASLKSLIIWSSVMLLLILTGVSKFSAYYNDPSMLAILDSFPKPLLDAMSLRAFNLTTLEGLFGLMFIYFGLMGAIATAVWGSDMISKEERDKTVEFALVLPVSRSRVITAKALAAAVNAALFVLVTWGVSIAAAQSFDPTPAFYNFLKIEMAAMFIIEMIFLAIGLLLGCAMKRYKLSGSTAIAIILTTYFLSIVSSMQENLAFLRYLTPFKYFDAAELYRTMRFDSTFLLLAAGIILVCIIAAYWTYNRRDLYI